MIMFFPPKNIDFFSEDDLADMDVTVTTRPQQSEPMQMPGLTFLMEFHQKKIYTLVEGDKARSHFLLLLMKGSCLRR